MRRKFLLKRLHYAYEVAASGRRKIGMRGVFWLARAVGGYIWDCSYLDAGAGAYLRRVLRVLRVLLQRWRNYGRYCHAGWLLVWICKSLGAR